MLYFPLLCSWFNLSSLLLNCIINFMFKRVISSIDTDILLATFISLDIDGLVYDCSNSIANALELPQCYTTPSIYLLQWYGVRNTGCVTSFVHNPACDVPITLPDFKHSPNTMQYLKCILPCYAQVKKNMVERKLTIAVYNFPVFTACFPLKASFYAEFHC